MAQGITDSVIIDGVITEGAQGNLKIDLSETYDIATNSSSLSVTHVWLKINSYTGTYNGDLVIRINGRDAVTLDGNSLNNSVGAWYQNTWIEVKNLSGGAITGNSGENIQHNDDGTKTVAISVHKNHWYFPAFMDAGGFGYTFADGASKNFDLTTIPRASSITSASNVTIGNACGVTWTPLSTSFRYRLYFSLGSWSGYTGVINPGTTSSYTYTGYEIPEDAAYQLPNSTTGTMTVTLRTYSDTGGNTQVGFDSSTTFTVTVQADAVPGDPSITAYLVNSNSIINSWNIALQGYTAIRLYGGSSGSYGSTISSYVISGGYSITRTGASLDYTGSNIYISGNVSFNVVAVDSRGRSSGATAVTVYFYPYSKPTISSFTAYRSSSNKESVPAKGVWSYSSANGNNGASGRVYYKLSTGSSWIANDSITNNTEKTLSWTFSTMSSYDVRLLVTDSLGGTAEYTIRIPTDAITFHLAQGGNGVGIGKYAEQDNLLDVVWPIRSPNFQYIRENLVSYTFTNLPLIDSPYHFKYGILFGGDTPGVLYMVFVSTDLSVTLTPILPYYSVTLSGAVSGTSLTITASSTVWGGLRLIWIN